MALATIDQLKEYLGTLGDEASMKDDDLLTRLVGAASSVIEAYCQRTFTQTTYTTEMYDGNGTDVLTLRNYPILSVSAVLEGGSAMSTSTDPAGGADVIIYAETGQLVRPYATWFTYRRWYSVTYQAGYATVPPGIVQACVELAAIMLKQKEHVGLLTKTTGVQTSTYLSSLSEGSQRALMMFQDYAGPRAT